MIRPLYRILQPFARRKHARYLKAYLGKHAPGNQAT
jgi:hypothetical protein